MDFKRQKNGAGYRIPSGRGKGQPLDKTPCSIKNREKGEKKHRSGSAPCPLPLAPNPRDTMYQII